MRAARTLSFAAILLVLVGVAACGTQSTGTAKPESAAPTNNYTVATTTDAVSFHPYLTTDTASSSYQGFVYAGGGEYTGLLRRDPQTLELVPDMAETWEISPDYTVFTFTLRSDLFWSDGQPITSEDYRWTFDQFTKPENEYPYRDVLDYLKSYETPDPRTIVVRIKERFCPALEGSEVVVPLPRHVWEKYDWKDPEKNPEIMHPTVVSGPFKVKEWVKGDHIIFEANDKFFRGRPKLDTYTVRIVPESEVSFTMLMNGEVDSGIVNPENYKKAKENPNLKMYEWWPARASWEYIAFNLRREALKDVNLRHALAYALDKDTMTDKVELGLGKRMFSCFPPTSPVYNPEVPHYDYDPDTARQLLSEAGYKPGSDGILEKDGQRLKLRLLYGPNTAKTREAIATIAQAQFKKVGVGVEVQGMEWGAFLEATQKDDWDMMVSGWSATVEPHWMWQIWSEEFIPDLNHAAYVNKQVEELFHQAGYGDCDMKVRKELYGQIQKIIAEDSPYIFLYYSQGYAAINKRIGGIVPSPVGLRYNLEDWYVEKQP